MLKLERFPRLMCAAALSWAMAASSAAAAAAPYQVIYTFQGKADGGLPHAALVADRAGNLYGTTMAGGINSCLSFKGCGVVFELAKQNGVWVETPLHKFTGWLDGGHPVSGVTIDDAGNLYGTTEVGGTKDFGVVFELVKANGYREKVLHAFTGSPDGSYPDGRPIVDKDGDVYGTTVWGGSTDCACGTVYKLTKSKGYAVIHNFAGVPGRDGAHPEAGLIADKDGNLYGTTGNGGFTNCDLGDGCGTVFRIAPDGTETVLYAFSGPDGFGVRGGVIRDDAGNLYGTTVNDEVNQNGLVFALAPDGTLSTLHAFTAGHDGIFPQAGLFADNQGNLYGTAEYGGDPGCGLKGWRCGIVFALKKNDSGAYSEKILHRFDGGSDGAQPWSTPVKDAPAGRAELFGTTESGGTGNCSGFDGCGVVFEITK